jgi:hypothetical protein
METATELLNLPNSIASCENDINLKQYAVDVKTKALAEIKNKV